MALLLFVWMAVIVAAFYGVQKPIALPIVRGAAGTGWMLVITGLLTINAAGLGTWLLLQIQPAGIAPQERLMLGAGLGLGSIGIVGFTGAAVGVTQPALLLAVQLGLIVVFAWRGILHQIWADARTLAQTVQHARTDAHPLLQGALLLAGLFAFLLALTPPADAFDALQYHLTLPEWILRDGGLQAYNVYPFWHPGMVEGVFVWALAFGSDRAPQMLHLVWTLLTLTLLWYWTRQAWGNRTGWYALAILLTMPSLPRLASWAYTDLALAFYSLAAIYLVWRWQDTSDSRWLPVAGIAAGMAMGVKYTSFVVPLTVGLLVLWWQRHTITAAFTSAVAFGLTAGVVALPWYLRNWLFVRNPVYPFVFDGRYWDAFRTDWYFEAGTGIGWNVIELVLLPFSATLGMRDSSFYGGRFGPIFLVLLPLAGWALWRVRRAPRRRRRAALTLTLFVGLSVAFWTLGIIRYSADLWQTRFLFPALIPGAVLIAAGYQLLPRLDSEHLQISFIVTLILAAVIALTLLETALFVVDRNPLAVATGVESREHYLHRVQPAYADAVDMLNETPADAHIYFLFEPRSYYVERPVQPDPILDNFAHGLYEHGNVETFTASLRSQGYTHVLLYRRGADFITKELPDKMPPATVAALDTLTDDLLVPIATTEDGGYELYVLPDTSE